MLKDMETQFINDENGMPDKVIMDYSEYVKIAKKMDLPLAPQVRVKERGILDSYRLTESANSILTGLIALASREQMLEADRSNPDEKRIAELKALGADAMVQYNDNANFSSLEKMEAIIEKYSPILLAEKKKTSVLSESITTDFTNSLKTLYRIAEDRSARIQEKIIHTFTDGKQSSDIPTVVILGGQPGAGKSELERIAREELGGNAVNCNADIFRDYHPQAERIKARHESHYPSITAEYAQLWNNGLKTHCEANRLNYILETTFSSGSLMNRTIADLKEKGYRVHIKVLAVNPRLSLLGTHYRFEEMKFREGAGRLVGKDAHDSRFHMIAPTLHLVNAKGLYDHLQLYGRTITMQGRDFAQGVVLLTSNPKNSLQVFQKETQRKWSEITQVYFERSVRDIAQMMRDRGAPNQEITQFKIDMKATYPTQAQMQEQTKLIISQQHQAELLDQRLAGKLPRIDMAGSDFIVDLTKNEIYEAVNPSNRINFNDLELSESGKQYFIYYDLKNHRPYSPADDITVLPKNVKLMEIPAKHLLDPYAVAMQKNIDIKEFLAEHPITEKIKATIYPLSDSYLPDLVKENLAKLEHKQRLEKGEDKSRGLSM